MTAEKVRFVVRFTGKIATVGLIDKPRWMPEGRAWNVVEAFLFEEKQ
jgi:hypothetical protein